MLHLLVKSTLTETVFGLDSKTHIQKFRQNKQKDTQLSTIIVFFTVSLNITVHYITVTVHNIIFTHVFKQVTIIDCCYVLLLSIQEIHQLLQDLAMKSCNKIS